MTVHNISFIGAGNVGAPLARELKNAGHRIISVSSESGESARKLAEETGAEWIADTTIPERTDMVILAVSDRAIEKVATEIRLSETTILVHTAGSIPLGALGRKKSAGVLYPLQTFSHDYSPEMCKVPFFTEATDIETLAVLKEIGSSIGAGAWECDSANRMKLHVAAVFANNFSNFMMTAGEAIAIEAGFDPSLLRPLMEETVRKALLAGPADSQTGPAVRHDMITMNNHIELLSFSPDLQDLYRKISNMISEYYNTGK